jgi:uncharacterized protein (TIGR00369 family)
MAARTVLPESVRKRLVAQLRGAPFVSSILRAKLLHAGPGEVVLALTPRDPLRQYQGLLQGGVLTGFADAAATIAMNSLLDPDEDTVTVQLSMNFLAPAVRGRLEASARAVHRGRRTAVATVEVKDARGRLACQGTFTSLIVKAAGAPAGKRGGKREDRRGGGKP